MLSEEALRTVRENEMRELSKRIEEVNQTANNMIFSPMLQLDNLHMAGMLGGHGDDLPAQDLKSKVNEIATEMSKFKLDLKSDILSFVRKEIKSGRLSGLDEAKVAQFNELEDTVMKHLDNMMNSCNRRFVEKGDLRKALKSVEL